MCSLLTGFKYSPSSLPNLSNLPHLSNLNANKSMTVRKTQSLCDLSKITLKEPLESAKASLKKDAQIIARFMDKQYMREILQALKWGQCAPDWGALPEDSYLCFIQRKFSHSELVRLFSPSRRISYTPFEENPLLFRIKDGKVIACRGFTLIKMPEREIQEKEHKSQDKKLHELPYQSTHQEDWTSLVPLWQQTLSTILEDYPLDKVIILPSYSYSLNERCILEAFVKQMRHHQNDLKQDECFCAIPVFQTSGNNGGDYEIIQIPVKIGLPTTL